jgi:hypothetical protein
LLKLEVRPAIVKEAGGSTGSMVSVPSPLETAERTPNVSALVRWTVGANVKMWSDGSYYNRRGKTGKVEDLGLYTDDLTMEPMRGG